MSYCNGCATRDRHVDTLESQLAASEERCAENERRARTFEAANEKLIEARAEAERLADDAWPIVAAYVARHPKWSLGGEMQDPNGCHAWLANYAALRQAEAKGDD